MLLSRMAWQLFWIGCNLQRAEDTTRLAIAHHALANRLGPSQVRLAEEFVKLQELPLGKREPTEENLLRLLLTDRDNATSVAAMLERVDLDIRTARLLLPEDAWRHVRRMRELCRDMVSTSRTQRQEVLEEFVRATLALAGVISTGMLRGEAYLFWQLGRQLAGAEMTCGIVHAAWHAQEGEEDDFADSLLWVQVLNAFGMLEGYRTSSRSPIHSQAAIEFLLLQGLAHHSVQACLSKAMAAVGVLPQNRDLLRALESCRAGLSGIKRRDAQIGLVLERIGKRIDSAIVKVHNVYFPALL